MSLEDADKKQNELDKKFSGIKRSLLKKLGLFLRATESCFNNFKSKKFPLKKPHKIPKPDPTPGTTVFDTPKQPRKEQAKKSPFN